MKNILIILSFVISLLSFKVALAAGKSCEDPSLPIKLSDLQFAGSDFDSLRKSVDNRSMNCFVIEGMRSDNQTSIKQKANCTLAAINPGNIYFLTDDKQKIAQAYSSTENKLGYYFCANMNEQKMCDSRKAELSKKGLEVSWRQQAGTSHYNSGDCLCKKAGSSGPGGICPAEPESMAKASPCKDPAAESKGGKCVCKVGGEVAVDGKACPTDPETQQQSSIDNAELDICLNDLVQAKNDCAVKAKSAVEQCDKESPDYNKNVSQAQRILEFGLDALIAKNAGTGALDACIKMGAAGTVLIKSLSLLRDSCKKEVNDCKKVCSDADELVKVSDEDYVKNCQEKFESANKAFTAAHQERLLELVKQNREIGESSVNYCKSNATTEQNNVEAFFDDLNNNVTKANICQCQLTTGVKSTNCQDVISPAGCMANPSQPGCTYSSVACTPASTNPACKITLSAGGAVAASNFAMPTGSSGAGFASVSGGGAAAGKDNINKMDLGSFADETRPSASATVQADMGSPFANGGGGSGGGGGGGGLANSLSSGDGAGGGGSGGGVEKDKGGLSGFFNTARNGIASLFGGSSSGAKAKTSKFGNSKSFTGDVNNFRPKKVVRGLADVSNEFGSKNRDIWKAMNDCYSNQYQTFITVENPTK